MTSAWDGIEEFVAVAEAGSFTAGAVVFGSSVTHMSRAVSRLEERLNAQLLARTTRAVHLTDAGRNFLCQCRKMVAERNEAFNDLVESAEPQGELRCTCTSYIGERFLTPIIVKFTQQFPQVRIYVELTSRLVDLVNEGYDFGIRTGHFNDPRLVRSKIGSRTLYTCASPGYLDREGRPETMADLKRHKCLLGSNTIWRFKSANQEVSLRPEPAWRFNSGISIASAMAAGLGISQLPDFYLIDYLRRGELEIVLDDFQPDPEPIWLAYPQRRHMQPTCGRLMDLISKEFPKVLQYRSNI